MHHLSLSSSLNKDVFFENFGAFRALSGTKGNSSALKSSLARTSSKSFFCSFDFGCYIMIMAPLNFQELAI